jgi:chemotaxis signal transduction protein
MKNTYLSFIIGDELYAVNVSKVLEVLEKQNISRVPNAPHYIKGIVNFRGDIVPVFETRDKFNLPSRKENDTYVIIVLDLSEHTEAFRIGAIVDRVKGRTRDRRNRNKTCSTMSKGLQFPVPARYIQTEQQLHPASGWWKRYLQPRRLMLWPKP